MSKSYRRWVYHAELEPKIINSDEFEKYEKEGWADTPAKFAKIKDFGVDENDPAAVQVLGEAIDGVKDRLNGELNIDVMKKQGLEEFARQHFNVELDCRRSLKTLRAQVKELLGNQ
jgi:hypothetical protein